MKSSSIEHIGEAGGMIWRVFMLARGKSQERFGVQSIGIFGKSCEMSRNFRRYQKIDR